MSVKRKNGLRQEYVTVVLGTQWGDEGKGRVVDMLSPSADIICRCQGGGNADHAVVIKGVRYQFHLLPSGIMNPKCNCIIGNGVVVHLPGLFEEIEEKETEGLNNWQDRLIISDRAHLVFDFHKQVDHLQELEKGNASLGTTKQGIGPAYVSKISRTGIRVGELIEDYDNFSEKFIKLVALHKKAFPNLEVDVNRELELYKVYADRVRPLVKDTVHYLHEALKDRKKILIEGANAALLDIDFGTYPYVTSSNTAIGGVFTGLGLSPNLIGEIIGVVKAYITRVGAGPFPTELYDIHGEMLQKIGVEIGGTTKRKRRCGWLDLVLLKYTTMLNGCTSICLTKLDILDVFPSFKVCVEYRLNNKLTTHFPSSTSVLAKVEPVYKEFIGWQTSTKNIRTFKELPLSAQKYVHLIEKYLDIPVKWVSVDADRESIITVC